MLLTEAKPQVQKSGTFKETNFKLKAGSKIFSLLSSSIYSDKIGAVVRELSTNAYDAHVAAGNDKPFDVHLPNWSEPFFKIRDYGTGLSEKDVFEIYTTYGESTKDNSDDFVGCLGLGSKSPFCVPGNDSFNVTSYFNGIKYEYTAYINEEGIPQIALIDTSKTKEPNGLEVHFSIENGDITKFVTAARRVYKWFPIQPNITGQTITIDSPQYGDVGGTITVNNKSIKWNTTSEGTSYVVMGNVAYPLTIDWTQVYQQLFYSRNFIIHVPIGFCNFTVSREALEYNKPTINNLDAVLGEILRTYAETLQKEIDNRDSYWEACKYFNNNAYSFSGILDKPLYNQKEVTRYLKIDLKAIKETMSYYSYSRYYEDRDTVAITPDSEFIIRDDSIAAKKKLKWASLSNRNTYLISDKLAEILKKEFECPDDIFTLQKDCEYDKVSGTSGGVRTTKILKWKGGRSGTLSWEDAKIKDTDKIYYVEVNRYNVVLNDKTISYDMFKSVVSELDLLKFKHDIYGIKTSIIKRARKNKNWIDLFEHIKPILEKYVVDNNDAINANNHIYYNMDWITNLGKLNVNNKEVIRLTNEFSRLKKLKDKTYPRYMMNYLGVEYKILPIWDELKSFEDKYPLVSYVSYSGVKANIKEYFELLEKHS